jgi:cell division protein FtsB
MNKPIPVSVDELTERVQRLKDGVLMLRAQARALKGQRWTPEQKALAKIEALREERIKLHQAEEELAAAVQTLQSRLPKLD